MRVLTSLMIALALSASAAAQTATPGQAFAFDYVIQDLTTYSVSRFEMRVDAGTWVSVNLPAVANDAQTPAGSNSYRVAVPALTPGTHAVEFRACNTGGCGSPSAAYSFTMVIVPPPPSGSRIVGVGQ